MSNDYLNVNELPRYQEKGAGLFAQNFIREFADSNITLAQIFWIEDYFKNVSDKGLW